jgi:hypothetical protein
LRGRQAASSWPQHPPEGQPPQPWRPLHSIRSFPQLGRGGRCGWRRRAIARRSLRSIAGGFHVCHRTRAGCSGAPAPVLDRLARRPRHPRQHPRAHRRRHVRRVEQGIGRVRIRATSRTGPVFVGIAREADLDRYLAATAHDELREVRAGADRYRSRDGGALPVVPREAGIWVASAEGEGTQAVEWDARDGRWAVAVLNADGARAVAADVSVGAKLGVLPWIGGGLLLLGLIGVAVGAGLIGIAVRGQSAPTPAAAPEGTGEPVAPGTYPVAWTPSSTRGSAAGCGS